LKRRYPAVAKYFYEAKRERIWLEDRVVLSPSAGDWKATDKGCPER
jgi:hypothetical protein